MNPARCGVKTMRRTTYDARGDAHWVGCGWYIDPARPFVETSKFDIIISVK